MPRDTFATLFGNVYCKLTTSVLDNRGEVGMSDLGGPVKTTCTENVLQNILQRSYWDPLTIIRGSIVGLSRTISRPSQDSQHLELTPYIYTWYV